MKKSDSKEDINDIAIRTVNSLGLIGSAVASKAQVKKLKSIDKSLAVATSSVLKIKSIFPKFIAAILPSGTPNITSSIATGGTAVNKPEKDIFKAKHIEEKRYDSLDARINAIFDKLLPALREIENQNQRLEIVAKDVKILRDDLAILTITKP
jgi:hypothetical protein